jgi:hypothetical protein
MLDVPLGRDTSNISAYIISAMELMFKRFVILVAGLHVYHAMVLDELVIVGLSMELH